MYRQFELQGTVLENLSVIYMYYTFSFTINIAMKSDAIIVHSPFGVSCFLESIDFYVQTDTYRTIENIQVLLIVLEH